MVCRISVESVGCTLSFFIGVENQAINTSQLVTTCLPQWPFGQARSLARTRARTHARTRTHTHKHTHTHTRTHTHTFGRQRLVVALQFIGACVEVVCCKLRRVPLFIPRRIVRFEGNCICKTPQTLDHHTHDHYEAKYSLPPTLVSLLPLPAPPFIAAACNPCFSLPVFTSFVQFSLRAHP